MSRPTYEEFVEKFKAKKTTDDCYTPEKVYNAVRDWVVDEYHVDAEKFVRPFYPGGDYENYHYDNDSIVVDNPPFSILAQIVKFYPYHDIKFFLFAPHKTLFNIGYCDVCLIGTCTRVIFENGANVNVSFITNLEAPGVRSAPVLYDRIVEAMEEDKSHLPQYEYPPEVLTFSIIGRMSAGGVDFKIDKNETAFIRVLDDQRKYGKSIYGAGFLISERAAKARQEAERKIERQKRINKRIVEWELSERERKIIASLA